MIDFNTSRPQQRPAQPSKAQARSRHEIDLLIEEARNAAETDWEEEFVADVISDRARWGDRFELSQGRIDKLLQITGQNEIGDGFDRR